jgi:sigma-B regulation protein RsbU (phosphoserine phosphatase)
MLALLNDALQERKLDSQYVTMLFCLWNDENQTLQVANSGAVPPVICRAGQSIPVHAEGFPIGMFPDVTYEEFSIATQPGDAIVFVSDGILDAENEKEEMYGEDRLAGLLCASRDLSAQEIADAILADVSRFQGSKDRFDDETIIVLRVRESDALPQTSKDPS